MRLSRVIPLVTAALVTCTAFSCGNLAPVSTPPLPQAARGFSIVKAAIDGDTVRLTDGRTIRVLAINTPETKDPRKRNPDGSYHVECGGELASAYAHHTLDGRRVTVQGDPTQDATDDFKPPRTLAYLILPDGQNYSVLAAEQGMGHAYAFHRTHPPQAYPEVLAAQSRAMNARLGIWGMCGGKP